MLCHTFSFATLSPYLCLSFDPSVFEVPKGSQLLWLTGQSLSIYKAEKWRDSQGGVVVVGVEVGGNGERVSEKGKGKMRNWGEKERKKG